MSVYIPKLAFRSDFSSFNSLYLSLPLFHVTARLVWTATFLADSRQLRQLGAKCDKLSRIPREWRRRKIFTPRMPVGRSSFLSLYQLPWPSVSFAYPSFPHRPRFPLTQASFRTYASTRTRLSAGQKYLHKSTMQSLFIFLRKHASNIHDRGEYIRWYTHCALTTLYRHPCFLGEHSSCLEERLKYMCIFVNVSGMATFFVVDFARLSRSLGNSFFFFTFMSKIMFFNLIRQIINIEYKPAIFDRRML